MSITLTMTEADAVLTAIAMYRVTVMEAIESLESIGQHERAGQYRMELESMRCAANSIATARQVMRTNSSRIPMMQYRDIPTWMEGSPIEFD